jgi:hypothetical protein
MTSQSPPSPTQDDDAWLEAIAGRPAPTLNPTQRAEVECLRMAWAKRRTSWDAQTPHIDDDFLQRMLERRSRESERVELLLSQPEAVEKPEIQSGTRVLPGGRLPQEKRHAINQAKYYWGLAASLMLATVLTLQLRPVDDEQTGPVLRGAESATVQIVDDPETHSRGLVKSILDLGELPSIHRTQDGAILIQVRATPGVLDFLHSMRIEPDVNAEMVTIRVMAKGH